MLRIDKELQDIGNRCIRNAPFDSWGQTGNEFYANLSRNNGRYRDTDYYYKGKYEFVHFTQFNHLFSILNECAFRLYDLNSSSDEDEYMYAAKVLNLSEHRMHHAKQNLFTFSCCPKEELKNEFVWKAYGKDYTGVAIVFEVVNDPDRWDNFHLGLIQYSVPESFARYSDELLLFQIEHGVEAEMDLSKLIGFHKKDHWAEEKEIRILTYNPFEDKKDRIQHLRLDYRRKENRNRMTRYLHLPFWVNADSFAMKKFNPQALERFGQLPSHAFVECPKIMIKDILIGKNSGLDDNEFLQIIDELHEIITYNLGYEINITRRMHGPITN